MRALLPLFLFLPVSLAGQSPLLLDEGRQDYAIGSALQILEDPQGAWGIDEVSSPARSGQFVRSTGTPNYGITHSIYWFRFALRRQDSADKSWLLEVEYPALDHIDLYVLGPRGVDVRHGGDQWPFHVREVEHRNTVFALNVEDQAPVFVYLRVQTESAMTVRLHLWTPIAFAEKSYREQLLLGLYYGLFGAMLLYNLFLFVSLRDANYLYYVLYVLGVGLFQACYNGLAYQYLWPSSPWLANRGLLVSIGLGTLGCLTFATQFLDLSTRAPVTARLCRLLMALCVLQVLLSTVAPYTLCTRLGTMLAMLAAVVMLTAGIQCWRQGYRPARFYVVAWTGFLAGILLLGLKGFGLLPDCFVTAYAWQIGSGVEVILLSLALADRIRILDEERRQARAEAMSKAEELEQARRIQLSVLPAGPPADPHYDIEVHMDTATEVGGDYYDFITADDGYLYVIAGDATGHGVAAGMMTSMTKSALHAVGLGPPESVLQDLNRVLRQLHPKRLFMALSITRLHADGAQYSSAAMPPALLYRTRDRTVEEILVPGMPLGGAHNAAYEGRDLAMSSGDVLVLTSDGLPERLDARDAHLGYETVQQCVARCGDLPAPELLAELLALGDRWGGTRPADDDVTVMVVRRR